MELLLVHIQLSHAVCFESQSQGEVEAREDLEKKMGRTAEDLGFTLFPLHHQWMELERRSMRRFFFLVPCY